MASALQASKPLYKQEVATPQSVMAAVQSYLLRHLKALAVEHPYYSSSEDKAPLDYCTVARIQNLLAANSDMTFVEAYEQVVGPIIADAKLGAPVPAPLSDTFLELWRAGGREVYARMEQENVILRDPILDPESQQMQSLKVGTQYPGARKRKRLPASRKYLPASRKCGSCMSCQNPHRKKSCLNPLSLSGGAWQPSQQTA